MRTPKVTQKTDLPNMILLGGDYVSGGTVLGFNFRPFPQISFDVTQHDPAYDYVAAAGFVNFPLMYRENRTDYPVFHNTFWNEDIETAGWSEGITYVTLTGYDSSKTDAENAPYVAAHCENRPQAYCTGLSTISDQNSKCTNFEEFEVTFDYKVDNFNSNDPLVSWGYCFLYHQGSSPTEYQNSIFYIAQVTGGTVIFCGKVPSYSGIDATDGTTSNNNLYISDILTTDWTEWQNVKIVTRYDTVNSVYAVYLYVNDTFVPLHAGNPDWNRTDGGLYTYYALSNRFNNFCTRNAYYTGGYWLKNFRIANIFPEHDYRWQRRPDNPSAITTENTFELIYYTASGIYNTCESKISLKTESQECFMLHGYYKTFPENVLQGSVSYGNNSLALYWGGNPPPYCEKNIATTESDFEITDNSYAYYGNTEIPFMWYPLESDLTTVYKQQGGISYSTWLQVSINNPVFSNGWCIISPEQVTSIDRLSISSGYQNIGFEFFIRITEADTDNMTGIVPVMCLFKTYDSGGYFPGTARTFNLCFIPGIDNDHGILGYWAIVSDNNTVMIKFPYFKNRSISHIAATYATTGIYSSVFKSINVFINGSLVFRINYKNDNKIMNQVNSAFGRMFTYGGATGFSGAIRGVRVYAGAGYLNYVNENRAFFRNEDSINFMDTFSDVQLGLSSYWNRVEEVIADQYFDPFTLYPDFRYPETIVYAMPVIKWRNETTGEDIDPSSFSIARSSVIRGSLSYDDPFGNNGIYIPDTAKITLNVVLQVPPTAVITTESLTVYKGTYIILDGSGSYDDITAYSWNTGAETAQISVQIMETTTFTLTVTNAYGTDSATVTVICKEVPEIIKKADIVPVMVTGQEIPLSPIPYQEVAILLNGQNCFISVRQLGIFLYCSLRVEGRQIFSNVICSINARVNVFRSPYFTGILRFYDTQGTEKPHYSGLGSRWILVYRAETLPGEFE